MGYLDSNQNVNQNITLYLVRPGLDTDVAVFFPAPIHRWLLVTALVDSTHPMRFSIRIILPELWNQKPAIFQMGVSENGGSPKL